MKILQINTSVNRGSTGRIAEEIGRVLLANRHESIIAYGRGKSCSESKTIKIGSSADCYLHVFKTRLFDLHGLGSTKATRNFIKKVQTINPDIIHLHNIHGYYLNYKILFQYLQKRNIPLVWTFHDCWPFTGHCAHFDYISCFKWHAGCFDCPNTQTYPKSLLFDSSKYNFNLKKKIFTGLNNLNIVVPSYWLGQLVSKSFFANNPIKVINNGIDLNVFTPASSQDHQKIRHYYGITGDKIILGVANIWAKHRGLADFIQLYNRFDSRINIVLIGLSTAQIKLLPKGIIGVERTDNTYELAKLYSIADIYVNPTWADTFPTTNLEALACGTPVVTYDTGGSPEAVDHNTGAVVPKGDIEKLHNAIMAILARQSDTQEKMCRNRAIELFDCKNKFYEYLELYKSLTSDNS